jgi:UDP:flavonoid glycosyltransferase YjiC (YdhE family)
VILVAVGTFIHGFDELVAAADRAAAALGLSGFAQIGHSRVMPAQLAWDRFLPPAALAARMVAARVVICHGGVGLLGEAMRAGKPIIAMPRRGGASRSSPSGDQAALVRRLAERHRIHVCEGPDRMTAILADLRAAGWPGQRYDLGTDIPDLIVGYLTNLG